MTRRGGDAVREVIPRGGGGAPGPNKSSGPGKSPGPLCQRQPRGAGRWANRRVQPHREGQRAARGRFHSPGSSGGPGAHPDGSTPLPGITGDFPTGSSPGKLLRSREDPAAPRAGTGGFGGTPGCRGAGRHPSGVRAVRRALLPREGRGDRPTPGPPGPWGDRGAAVCPPGIAVSPQG